MARVLGGFWEVWGLGVWGAFRRLGFWGVFGRFGV